MTENRKMEYETPMVDLLKARVEKGFQLTGADADAPQSRTANEALTYSGESYGGNDFN